MAKSPVRTFWLALAALIALAGGYGVWWLKAADQARDTLIAWIEGRRAQGWTIQHGAIAATGFPGTLRLAVESPALARPSETRPWSWRGPERVMVEIHPLAPHRLKAIFPGRHVLDLGPKGAFDLSLQAGSLEVTLAGERLDGGHLALAGVELSGLAGATGKLALARLDLDVQDRHPARPEDLKQPSWTAGLELEGLDLPQGITPPLGPRVAKARVGLALYGVPPANSGREALRAWSEAGGTLEAERLELIWEPLDLVGDGTVALDRDLAPLGSFFLIVRGAFDTVDALVKRGLVKPGDSMLVKLALAVLAKNPPEGESGSLRLPLSVQNNQLMVGPARLLRLPDWTAKD
jgi:hypothetical protein